MTDPTATLRGRLRAAGVLVLDLAGGLTVYGASRLTAADRDAIVATARRVRQQLAVERDQPGSGDQALAIAKAALEAEGDLEPVDAMDGSWGAWRRRLADRERVVRQRLGLPVEFGSPEALVAAIADLCEVAPDRLSVHPRGGPGR